MNPNNPKIHPALIALGSGFSGLLLRTVLYRTGFDGKGILSASHPLHLACLVLTVITLVSLALLARKSKDGLPDRPLLRLPLGLAAGCFLLLHGLNLQAFSQLTHFRQNAVYLLHRLSGLLPLLYCGLTLTAAAAMVLPALSTGKHRNLSAVCHGIVCLSFAADMLSRYRTWSGNPQLPDYVFHVLAGTALSLGSYQTLALHTGLGKRTLQQFFCLSALFLCTLCLSGPEPRAFYLSGALWAAVCLLTVVPPEEEDPLPEENDDVSA